MLDRDTASLPAHSSHANDRFADVIVTSLVVSVLTSHGGRGRDSGRLGVYRLSVGVSGGICHRHWLQRQQQQQRRRRRPRRWRVQVSTCRAVCPSLPRARSLARVMIARTSNVFWSRATLDEKTSRRNSTSICTDASGLPPPSCFGPLPFTQWRHLGGLGGGFCGPPPRRVKCKSFALSVSSKGSLYISHNGR